MRSELALALAIAACAGPAIEDEPAMRTTCSVRHGSEAHLASETVYGIQRGLVVDRVTTRAAPEPPYREEYVYDARGRLVRVAGLIDGTPTTPLPARRPRHLESERAVTVELDIEGRVAGDQRAYEEHSGTFTFDEGGRPVRRDALPRHTPAGEPPMRWSCTYDSRGRPSAYGLASSYAETWIYDGDAVWPSRVVRQFADAIMDAVVERADDGTIRVVDRNAEGIELRWVEHRGDCAELFFAPCAPMLAPPPPGGARARLPSTRAPR